MMIRTKARVAQHIMENESIQILTKSFPKEWVLREYKPDYGIDISVEVFGRKLKQEPDDGNYYSLGEMFFIQAKSVKKAEIKTISVPDLMNVEKEYTVASTNKKKIDVLGFRIETTELSTIHSMGAGTPVLLFLIDISSKRIFYLCLNDCIDKVILPIKPAFHNQTTLTIYIPIKNEITDNEHSLYPIRFYAKRSKYYALFLKFVYQRNELKYSLSRKRVLYFIDVILRNSIWNDMGNWGLFSVYYEKLMNMKSRLLKTKKLSGIDEIEIRALWDGLACAGNTYEELCREMYLPTYRSTEITTYCHLHND